ncbi:MAG: SpvB/TcaC N-terminal domain-containing protein [Myxococcales bacterium]
MREVVADDLAAGQHKSTDKANHDVEQRTQENLESVVADHQRQTLEEQSSSAPVPFAGEGSSSSGGGLPTGGTSATISGQQIALPKGEGSIQGMGESFTPNLSSGTGTFSVPIALPKGRAGVQPSLSLAYSTSGGDGVAGLGWSVAVPFISRQTDKGLPHYVDGATWHFQEDTFMYNGGQELVPVDSSVAAGIDTGTIPAELSGWQQYRAKVEGAFMRFFRSPDSARWVVQAKDGTRFDFGACPSAESGSCQAAVQTDPEQASRIFSWALVRMSDAHGSTVDYRYLKDGGNLYLQAIYYTTPVRCAAGYAATARACSVGLGEYAHRVAMVYEAREDRTSSYASTWRTERNLRLKRIDVTSAAAGPGTRTLVRRYHLRYEPGSYHSLLSSVQVEGRPSYRDTSFGASIGDSSVAEESLSDAIVGELLPPISFAYSKPSTTAGQVAGFGGIDNTLHTSSASPEVSADEARVEFFDVNADGLTDVLVTDPARYDNGAGVYFNGFSGNTPAVAGAFSVAAHISVPAGLASTLNLASVNIVPMDVDGDGREDILHMPRSANYGYFLLSKDPTPTGGTYAPLEGWSFAHVSNLLPSGVTDPRIDLGADGVATKTLDVNKDHLIDIVRTTGSKVQTWLNLGRYPGGEGRFGSATANANGFSLSTEPTESCLPYAGQNLGFDESNVRIADMNGDGIVDIAHVASDRVIWWPGRGEGAFGDGSHACDDGNRAQRHFEMSNPPQELNPDLAGLQLSDVNEDGTADLLLVGFDFLSVWFNRGGEGFSDRLIVDNTPFAAEVLGRVRVADIDGSTTSDLVYAQGGNYRWIDFMGGTKPRLLVGVDNGLGALTTLEYGSSAQDYLRDLKTSLSCDPNALDCFTWHHEPLLPDQAKAGCDAKIDALSNLCVHRISGSPVLSSVVRRITTTDRLDVLGAEASVSETEYRYHDGYYEGIEQEFRGFRAADAIAYGDAYQPTSITRTYFHQGQRPNELSTERLADNPNEALKGREYLTEVFDESGNYLSTSHAGYVVRRLMHGLNGSDVSYAFVKATDEFRYDTSNPDGRATVMSLQSVAREEATIGGGPWAMGAAQALPGDANHAVPVRAFHYARIRNVIDVVDNVGNQFQQTAWGRGGVGEFGEQVGDERIASVTAPTRLYDDACSNTGWLWRTAESYVADSAGVAYGRTQFDYTSCGDQKMAGKIATLPSVGAFEFAATTEALGFAQTTDNELGSATYDSWGQPLQACGGGLLADQTNFPCLRLSQLGYDEAYQDLVASESIATDATGGTPHFLTTTAAWDRGLGVLVATEDANGYLSQVSYDGLGRLTSLVVPSVRDCAGTRVPSTLIEYDVTTVPSARPLSRVSTTTLLSCGSYGDPASQLVNHSYVDGLGRARATLSEGETDADAWEDGRPHSFILSGRQIFTKRGQPRLAYQSEYFDGSADDFQAAIARPNTPYTRAMFDAFGRPTLSINEDNTYSSISYHALSRDLCDEVDNGFSADGNQDFRGSCTTERSDGHGRVIDQQLRQVTSGGTHENHRLFSFYRPDGAVTRVVRMMTPDNMLRPEGGIFGSYVERRFHYDSLGRRVASEDPDTDNRAESSLARRTWRYLYNRAGDLVAVRDPRGCGQNFYYDLAGRLVGEAYASCSEAQSAELASSDVPAGSVSLGLTSSVTKVHARYHFDAYPSWAGSLLPSDAAGVLGKLTASEDRAQRSAVAYDQRGNTVWSAKQLAVIAPPANLPAQPSTGTDGRPVFDGLDETNAGTASVLYDTQNTYERTSSYDHAGRPYAMGLPQGGAGAPSVGGKLHYYANGAVRRAEVLLDQTAYPVVAQMSYTRDGLSSRTVYGDQAFTGRAPTASSTIYDARRRPFHLYTARSTAATALPGTLGNVSVVTDQRLTWDGSSNLVSVEDLRPGYEWPRGHKPFNQFISHDALYRVAHVNHVYETGNSLDDASDWRDTEDEHRDADPMASTAAPMLSAQGSARVVDLEYSYDWLANMTSWDDDGHMFYERSLGSITNGANLATGASPARRPSALYLASNLDPSTPTDLGGWVETDYGRGGNLLAMTVHARCVNASASTCSDPGGSDPSTRRSALRSRCSCQSEQHYVYRWDALNRLQEARRYDRTSGGSWSYAARQRYRYDSQNQRTVKHTLVAGSSDERAALYVFPGDFELRGMVVDAEDGDSWVPVSDEAEAQYLIAGARLVWKNRQTHSSLFDPEHRLTLAITNLVGSTSAVVDLVSGELTEVTGFYPNGAREHWLTASGYGEVNPTDALQAADLVGWLNPDDLDEGPVSSYWDRVSHQTLDQDDPEKQPIKVGNAINGRAALKFLPVPLSEEEELGQVLRGRHVLSELLGQNDALTVYTVSSPKFTGALLDYPKTGGYLWSTVNPYDFQGFTVSLVNWSTPPDGWSESDDVWENVRPWNANQKFYYYHWYNAEEVWDEPVVHVLSRDESGTIRTWINGNPSLEYELEIHRTYLDLVLGGWPVGPVGDVDGTEDAFSGFMGDVVVYNTAHSDERRDDITALLAAKWGIAGPENRSSASGASASDVREDPARARWVHGQRGG